MEGVGDAQLVVGGGKLYTPEAGGWQKRLSVHSQLSTDIKTINQKFLSLVCSRKIFILLTCNCNAYIVVTNNTVVVYAYDMLTTGLPAATPPTRLDSSLILFELPRSILLNISLNQKN